GGGGAGPHDPRPGRVGAGGAPGAGAGDEPVELRPSLPRRGARHAGPGAGRDPHAARGRDAQARRSGAGRGARAGLRQRLGIRTRVAEISRRGATKGSTDGRAKEERMKSMNEVVRVRASTALGEFMVEAAARGLRAVSPVMEVARVARNLPPANHAALAHAVAAAEALRRYAVGERPRFDGPLDLDAPALHLAVWERLRAIPFGATATYGEIAAAVGQPGGARAIGAAGGGNPGCILTRCRRVVGADGALRGFRWGLDLKRRLLAHEGSAALPLFAESAR